VHERLFGQAARLIERSRSRQLAEDILDADDPILLVQVVRAASTALTAIE